MVLNIPQLQVDDRYPRIPLGGLYIISSSDTITPTTLFKIGKSINLKSRCNSYHICFPNGFFIFGLLVSSQRGAGKEERKRRTDDTTLLERELFQMIKEDKPNARIKTMSGAKEAFSGLTQEDINRYLETLMIQHSDIVLRIHTGKINSVSGNKQWIAQVKQVDYEVNDEGDITTMENMEQVFDTKKAVDEIDKAVKKQEKKQGERKRGTRVSSRITKNNRAIYNELKDMETTRRMSLFKV